MNYLPLALKSVVGEAGSVYIIITAFMPFDLSLAIIRLLQVLA